MYSPVLCAAIFIYLSIQYSLCKLVFLVNKTDESKLDNYPEMSTQQQNLVDEVESSFQVNSTLLNTVHTRLSRTRDCSYRKVAEVEA